MYKYIQFIFILYRILFIYLFIVVACSYSTWLPRNVRYFAIKRKHKLGFLSQFVTVVGWVSGFCSVLFYFSKLFK